MKDFILPFSFSFDTIQRLLLVSFERDPDSLYLGFEAQVLPGPQGEEEHLVIGWRRDGRVDVYHSSRITPDPLKYTNVGKGLAHLVPRDFIHSCFEIEEGGVRAQYAFQDIEDRVISLQIREDSSKKPKPFPLLAPVGYASASPSALFLVYLHHFYFIRKKNTLLRIQIGSREHKPDSLPFPLDGQRLFYSRYSGKPLVVYVNPDFEGILPHLTVEEGKPEINTNRIVGELNWENGVLSLKKLVLQNPISPVELRFQPFFPSLLEFSQKDKFQGTFELDTVPSVGPISGTYVVEKQGDSLVLELHPQGGWQPRPDRLSLRLLFSLSPVFHRWPSTYRWKAVLTREKDGTVFMKSHWRREGKI